MQKANDTSRPTVCILGPHPLALESYQRALSRAKLPLRVARLESVLMHDISRMHFPIAGVYVIDLNGPFPAVLVGALLNQMPNARVIALSDKFDDIASHTFLRLGVKGLLTYAAAGRELPRAVQAVARGGFWVDRRLLSRFVDSILPSARGRHLASGAAKLSRREQQVLEALLEHLSNKEIASRLHITERTAKFHVSRLLAKFGVQRRADLSVLYYQSKPPLPA